MAAKAHFRSIFNVGRQGNEKGRSIGGVQCEIRVNHGGNPRRRSARLSVSIQGGAQAVRTVGKAACLAGAEGSVLRRVRAAADSGSASCADARACVGHLVKNDSKAVYHIIRTPSE